MSTTPSIPISVGLVEDEALLRRAVAEALTARGIDVRFDVGDAAAGLQAALDHRPDVLVLDLHLGLGPTGLDVARAVRRQQTDVGVVLLTSFEDPRILGGRAEPPVGTRYLVKGSLEDVDGLVATIVDAAQRPTGRQGRRDSAGLGVTRVTASSDAPRLTDAQLETLRLVAKGLSNAEIARIRVITEKSVENTVTRLARTLGVRPEATRNQRVSLARAYFRMIGAKRDVEA